MQNSSGKQFKYLVDKINGYKDVDPKTKQKVIRDIKKTGDNIAHLIDSFEGHKIPEEYKNNRDLDIANESEMLERRTQDETTSKQWNESRCFHLTRSVSSNSDQSIFLKGTDIPIHGYCEETLSENKVFKKK
eukprot:90769_1